MISSPLVSRWFLLVGLALMAVMTPVSRVEAASGPKVAPLTLTAGGLEVGTDEAAFEARVRELKRMGFTSVQTYVYWNKVEPSPGEIDWSEYDREVEIYTRAGLKWVPFIIMGPWYVTPQWVREKPGMVMYRCLEHGREMAIPSLWSPGMRDHVRHTLRQLAAHYAPKGVLESVNIGITGDYGEAIYPVIGNWPGEYHSHAGYWCGDALAEADFRAQVQTLYPEGIAALNQAWRSSYRSWGEVRPFLPAKAPSERAWQEFLAWYRDEMTEFSDFCLAETRAAFPGVDVSCAPAGIWLRSTVRTSPRRRKWRPSTGRGSGSPTRAVRSAIMCASLASWRQRAVIMEPFSAMNRHRMCRRREWWAACSMR